MTDVASGFILAPFPSCPLFSFCRRNYNDLWHWMYTSCSKIGLRFFSPNVSCTRMTPPPPRYSPSSGLLSKTLRGIRGQNEEGGVTGWEPSLTEHISFAPHGWWRSVRQNLHGIMGSVAFVKCNPGGRFVQLLLKFQMSSKGGV